MNPSIDLILLGGTTRQAWLLGRVFVCSRQPSEIAAKVQQALASGNPEGVLFWDEILGPPEPDMVRRIFSSPGDLWHAGLRLGLAGQPGLIDYFMPTWMLNRDPDPVVEATSWRASLRACLVRSAVLRDLGSVRTEFESIDGASLEMGHRFIQSGVLMRHVPSLLARQPELTLTIPLNDEVRFLRCRAQAPWRQWAFFRALITGYGGRVHLASALSSGKCRRLVDRIYKQPASPRHFGGHARVTVLIPTIDRYPYLRTLLSQLRKQTIPPMEIILIDQTSSGRRDPTLEHDFPDLPVRYFTLDQPGQCSSRNLGLLASRGDYILFLDDDDEVEPDLIERHLANLEQFDAAVSNGVAHEVGAGALPEDFTYVRASNVFPTNNTLVKREVLERSGLFDLAFNRGQRADADLGARVYYSGALMVLSPEIAVLHHHAPQGGLRTHKARVVTFAGSRKSLWLRHLPTATEVYLALRYFSPRQLRESFWIRAAGTFGSTGGRGRKALKMIVAGLLFFHTRFLSSHARRSKHFR